MKHFIYITIIILLFGCGPETKSELKKVSVNNNQGGFLKCANLTGNKKNKFFKYVDSGNYKEAEKVYFKNIKWFKSCEHKLENYVPKLANKINKKYDNKLSNLNKYFKKENINFDWIEYKNKHDEATKLVSLYKKERFLNQHYKYKISYVKEIEINISKNNEEFKNNLSENFKKYDLFKVKKSFFDEYPYTAKSSEKNALLNNSFQSILLDFSNNKLANNNNFIKNYFVFFNQSHKSNIQKLYLEKFYEENDIDEANLSLIEYINLNNIIVNSIPKNMAVPKIEKKLAFFNIDSSNSIDLDFKYKIKNDSKLINEFVNIEENEFNKKINDYDYIFAFLIDGCIFETFLESKNIHNSKFVSGTQQINNPKYNKLVNRVNIATNKETSAYYNQQYECNKICPYGYEWTCVATCATWTAAYLKWVDEKNIAQKQLQSTSPYIDKKIYQPYDYYSTKVKANKITKYNLIIFDNVTKEGYLKKMDTDEFKFFDLVYNLNSKDEDKNKILKRYQKEQDINNWGNQIFNLSINQIIEYFKKNKSNFNSIDSNFSLASLSSQKNKINQNDKIAENISNGIDYFKSVAKIIRGDGGFGSGFFITESIIITNQHVIDNTNLINIELFDGRTGTGKLIAQDFSKDLAAIKSTISAEPVEISNESLNLGKDVIAVGHPEGLGFSLTKGIISAVRKQQSINDFGFAEVEYIQTDAAINHGNSGGPLFLNGKLVGVNTQGVRKDIAEGLNFAVHKNELIEFLKKSLSQYIKIEE